MATNKRMFSNEIVGSDAFLEMPTSTQALYFHLNMKADDDGFINPKMIMRMVGCGEDDLRILVGKKFVIPFEDGVMVVKHWLINNNKIQKDRYKPTLYTENKKALFLKENNAYTIDESKGEPLLLTECYQDVNTSLTQNRLEENRLEENKYIKRKFQKPTLEEVRAYCEEIQSLVIPEEFMDSNDAKGWVVGTTKTPMKDWKAVIRTWDRQRKAKKTEQQSKSVVLKTEHSSELLAKLQGRKLNA